MENSLPDNNIKSKSINQDTNKDKKNSRIVIVIGILIIIILLLGLGTSIVLVRQETVFWGRAKGNLSNNIEINNSYIFASPLKAGAGGKEQIRITAFILDTEGKGVSGSIVALRTNKEINIDNQEAVTDSVGQVSFDISSHNPGVFEIGAKVNGLDLPQTVTVIFE